MKISSKSHRTVTLDLIVKHLMETRWYGREETDSVRCVAEKLLDKLTHREQEISK